MLGKGPSAGNWDRNPVLGTEIGTQCWELRYGPSVRN